MLFVLGAAFAFLVVHYRLICFAVPCDTFLTVRGSVVAADGRPVDGCTLIIAAAPGGSVLPGETDTTPFDAHEAPETFEIFLTLTPWEDRYNLQLVDCPGGAASAPIPVDLDQVASTHELGRVLVTARH